MQCVSDSSVSLDPNEPDAPIAAAAVGKSSSTPKGAKPKGGRDSLQSSSLRDGGVSLGQPEPAAPVRKDVDALASVTKYIGPALKGLSPKNQLKVDTAIMQQTALEGIRTNMQHVLSNALHFRSYLLSMCNACFQLMCVHCVVLADYLAPLFPDLRVHPSSTLACSCAVAVAGAQFLKTPLFLHLSTFIPPSLSQPPTTNNTTASQKASKIKSRFTMPIPIVSALAGGQLLIGKLRFHEFCFTPLSGTPFPEQVKILVNVHSELGKTVQGKAGVSEVISFDTMQIGMGVVYDLWYGYL